MCRYDRHRAGEDCPNPGDGVCNSPTVGALTASVMAALATLDGIVCESDGSVCLGADSNSLSVIVICPELGGQAWSSATAYHPTYSGDFGNLIHDCSL